MEQSWFELNDIKRRKINKSVWIPLRQRIKKESGNYGFSGYREEFNGTGSVAIPSRYKSEASKLGWTDIGLTHDHSGFYYDGVYTPVDLFENGEIKGTYLVLSQYFNSLENKEWHVNQDLVTAMKLKREGDIWISPNEGYIEVIRLYRDDDGSPNLIEIRAEHLKDYLCARDLYLYITSFYSRIVVVEDASFITWEKGSSKSRSKDIIWEGRIIEIHEGGNPFGEKIAIFHAARTDVDDSDDIPDLAGPPTDENIKSSFREKSFEGRKLFRISGELWKNDWIEPSKISTRIKGDELTPSVNFISDTEGTKENKSTLIHSGKWLWFKPDVIMALSHRRGGFLSWYTRDTGSVACSPDDGVHFGVNDLGIVNVYAKDIVLLPEWQQTIWAGFNISPEGGVSKELLASQVRAQPANTQAPEKYFKEGLRLLDNITKQNLMISILREHDATQEIFGKIHRFRAVDESGLFALAKDIARLTADIFDTSEMQKIIKPPKKEKWGSLKTLENLLSIKISPDQSHEIMGPLVGAYELRHADAHLPSSEINEALSLLQVDRKKPFITQGYLVLHAVVSSLYAIIEVIKEWDNI